MFRKILKNLILYVFCFTVAVYLHKDGFYSWSVYDKYLGVFILSWAVSSIMSRKFRTNLNTPLLNRLYTYTISFFLMLGILAMSFYQFNLVGVSRAIILYSLLFAYLFEVSLIMYNNKEKVSFKNINISYNSFAFLFEVNLFEIISFYLCYLISRKISPGFDSTLLFISLSLSWFTGSFLGHHFSLDKINSNYLTYIWQYLKTYIIILALSLFSAFFTRLDPENLIYIFYGIIIYAIISFTGATIYYYTLRHRRLVLNFAGFPIKGEFGDILLNEKIETIQNYRSDFNGTNTEILQKQLKNLSLKRYPQVYEFVDRCLDLNSFDGYYSLILKSDSIVNVEFLPESSLQLLINLQKLNQIRSIDEYLIEINKKLVKNGIFIGNFETVYLRHAWFLQNYPYYFAQMFYFFDFLWNRLFSKIIFCRSIYKALMGDTNKALSLAEGLGRIYYCGFNILHLRIINNSMFFIAKKNGGFSKDARPSTGILFRMKRLGKDGKEIYVYKLRTMHPYAQYLQKFVYEKFNLQEGGKLNNDFRVTYWGKILRKLWLDELPMIYNWFKGDLKLVGCRPLSKQYFDLYTDELKEKRLKIKPGLIPPFYADIPKTLEEIMESERKYLEAYARNPVKTDVKYFFRSMRNIILHGARSS